VVTGKFQSEHFRVIFFSVNISEWKRVKNDSVKISEGNFRVKNVSLSISECEILECKMLAWNFRVAKSEK